MKINILDAGLKFRAGHQFDYGLKLVRYLAGAGHDVHVYGYVGMDDDVADAFAAVAPLTKLFRTYQYDLMPDYDWYAGELVEYQQQSAATTTDLAAVREADLWIWPTMTAAQLNACAKLGIAVPMVGCVYWDPGVDARTVEAMLWRDAMLAGNRADLRFTLASVEAELRHCFAPIVPWPVRFKVLPHPIDVGFVAEPKRALKRIGIFGHQREEKGAELLIPLLERLVDDGYAITLQNSNLDWSMPPMKNVKLLGYVDDIAAEIAACDLVILPYHIARYRMRGSGVLAQCLALGVPMAGPLGTLAGKTIEQFGIGTTFGATAEEPILFAVKAAKASYSTFAARAFKVAGTFAKRNGVSQFASALLTAAK